MSKSELCDSILHEKWPGCQPKPSTRAWAKRVLRRAQRRTARADLEIGIEQFEIGPPALLSDLDITPVMPDTVAWVWPGKCVTFMDTDLYRMNYLYSRMMRRSE